MTCAGAQAYMSEQLEKLGWSKADALDRAVLMSYIYVGRMQMAHALPRVISDVARRRHFELVFGAFATGGLPERNVVA